MEARNESDIEGENEAINEKNRRGRIVRSKKETKVEIILPASE